MQILYISALSSKKIIDEIYLKTKRDPGFAVQKFTRLMVDGFIANNASVIALSVPQFQVQWIQIYLLILRMMRRMELNINISHS